MASKRRKPKGERKEESLRIRMTAAEKTELEAAAKAAFLDLSAWIRKLALETARGRKS